MGCAPATLDPMGATSQSLLSISAIVGINGCYAIGWPVFQARFQAQGKFRASIARAVQNNETVPLRFDI